MEGPLPPHSCQAQALSSKSHAGRSPDLPAARRDRDVWEKTCVVSSFPCLSHDFVCRLPCLAMILAGKAYYDGVAKIGEIATGSPVSTELGELTVLDL